MSDKTIAQKWDEYLFFGGPMPSLMEGVKPIRKQVLKRGLEKRMLKIQELLVETYDAIDRIANEQEEQENETNH